MSKSPFSAALDHCGEKHIFVYRGSVIQIQSYIQRNIVKTKCINLLSQVPSITTKKTCVRVQLFRKCIKANLIT